MARARTRPGARRSKVGPKTCAHSRRTRAGLGGAVVAVLLGACDGGDPVESEEDTKATFQVVSSPKKKEKPPLPDPVIWETPQEDPALEAGRLVWTGTCIQCHSVGLGGAPLIGNRELWAPRLEQGLDVLIEHAMNGFYGKKGEMPARGGNPDLTDEDIRAAVLFMTSRAQL